MMVRIKFETVGSKGALLILDSLKIGIELKLLIWVADFTRKDAINPHEMCMKSIKVMSYLVESTQEAVCLSYSNHRI